MKPRIFLLARVIAVMLGLAGGAAVLNGPALGAPDTVQTTDHVSQFGITWHFDKPRPTGRFANGDIWVVGPVTIVKIDPASQETDGRTRNGSMVNPSPKHGALQGYDSAMYGGDKAPPQFSAKLNAARPGGQDLSASNPLRLKAGSSLVSTLSVEAVNRPQLQRAAILTVLGEAPPPGSFRPPYSGSDKRIAFNQSQIDDTRLKNLAPVAGTPRTDEILGYFEKPWIDHIPTWLGRHQHPIDNMPDYGREIAMHSATGALALNLKIDPKKKRELAIRYIQLGIDLYGVVEDGGHRNWVPDGGHANGRKLPILVAGDLLGDPAMRGIGERDDVVFSEDAQTFYVSESDIKNTHSPGWNPDKRSPKEPYEAADLGTPEWGIRHGTDPLRDNRSWEAKYRRCCTANVVNGSVLAARLMGLQEAWNHDALFDYMDRYMDRQEDGWMRSYSKFLGAMWDTYRQHDTPN